MAQSELPCLGALLHDVLTAQPASAGVFSVQVVQSQPGLQQFWPELKFANRARSAAVMAASRRWRPTGLAFRPGLLRAPAAQPASSTISATYRLGAPAGSLAARLLAHPVADAARERGARVAAEIVGQRLGGESASNAVQPMPPGARLLVASGAARLDRAAFGRLLQSGAASSIALLGGSDRLGRAVVAAGGRVVGGADPWALIDAATEIHAGADTEISVLAMLAGRSVVDLHGEPVPLVDPGLLAAAALVLGTRYLDPADGRLIAAEAFLDRAIEWRRLRQRLPAIACVAGISFWKKRRITEFLGTEPVFARTATAAISAAQRRGGGIAVWPSREPKGLAAAAAKAQVPLLRIEDGFIRSRGLGADFIPPASIIIDATGIYYDTRSPSDLEHLLQNAEFPPELLARAHRLTQDLVRRGITKYNVGAAMASLPSEPGRRRILVPGQVADDKSVQAGGGGLSPGLPLLQRVRAANPDAFIVYKPHPDVEAGHRPGVVPDASALRYADLILRDAPMGSLIEGVDEIHTLTSLAGFEGLLRGRRVVTYGAPFYAGWGLTTDLNPPSRPRRRLSLDALVAATLILYPYYLDPVSKLPCQPEDLVQRLDTDGNPSLGLLVMARRLQGALRRKLAPASEIA